MQRGKEGTGRRKKGGNGKREGVRERREGWNGRRKGSQNIEVQNPEPWGKEEVSAKYKKQKHRNSIIANQDKNVRQNHREGILGNK